MKLASLFCLNISRKCIRISFAVSGCVFALSSDEHCSYMVSSFRSKAEFEHRQLRKLLAHDQNSLRLFPGSKILLFAIRMREQNGSLLECPHLLHGPVI